MKGTKRLERITNFFSDSNGVKIFWKLNSINMKVRGMKHLLFIQVI